MRLSPRRNRPIPTVSQRQRKEKKKEKEQGNRLYEIKQFKLHFSILDSSRWEFDREIAARRLYRLKNVLYGIEREYKSSKKTAHRYNPKKLRPLADTLRDRAKNETNPKVRASLLSLCTKYYTGWDRDFIPFGFNSEAEKEQWEQEALDELYKLCEYPSSRECLVILDMLLRKLPFHLWRPDSYGIAMVKLSVGEKSVYERMARLIVEIVCDAKRRLNKNKPISLSKSNIKTVMCNLDVQELSSAHISDIVNNAMFMHILFDRGYGGYRLIYEVLFRASEEDRLMIFNQYEKAFLSTMMAAPFSFIYSCAVSSISAFIFSHPVIIDRITFEMSRARFPNVNEAEEEYRSREYELKSACATACVLLRKCLNEPSRLEEMLGHGLLLAAGHLSTVVEGDRYERLFRQILDLHPQCKPSFAELTEKGPQSNRLADLGQSLLLADSIPEDYVYIEDSYE